MKTTFIVMAGKYDGHERNCKFSGEVHESIELCQPDIDMCKGYPWIEIWAEQGAYRFSVDPSTIEKVISDQSDEHPAFINTYKAMYGWKNQLIAWSPEGYYEPYETDYFQFPDDHIEEAIAGGIYWAISEDIEYKAPAGYEATAERIKTGMKLERMGYDLTELEQDNPYNPR